MKIDNFYNSEDFQLQFDGHTQCTKTHSRKKNLYQVSLFCRFWSLNKIFFLTILQFLFFFSLNFQLIFWCPMDVALSACVNAPCYSSHARVSTPRFISAGCPLGIEPSPNRITLTWLYTCQGNRVALCYVGADWMWARLKIRNAVLSNLNVKYFVFLYLL